MSWEDLEKKKHVELSDDDAAFLRLHAAAFGSGAGAQLLDHYHRLLVDAVTGPNVSEAALRHREGQRALIVQLQTFTKRGFSLKS